MGKWSLLSVFINKLLLGHSQAHSFTWDLWLLLQMAESNSLTKVSEVLKCCSLSFCRKQLNGSSLKGEKKWDMGISKRSIRGGCGNSLSGSCKAPSNLTLLGKTTLQISLSSPKGHNQIFVANRRPPNTSDSSMNNHKMCPHKISNPLISQGFPTLTKFFFYLHRFESSSKPTFLWRNELSLKFSPALLPLSSSLYSSSTSGLPRIHSMPSNARVSSGAIGALGDFRWPWGWCRSLGWRPKSGFIHGMCYSE